MASTNRRLISVSLGSLQEDGLMIRMCSHSEPRAVSQVRVRRVIPRAGITISILQMGRQAHRGADSHSWERWRLKSCACLERGELGMNPAEPAVHIMKGSSSQTGKHRGCSVGRVHMESQALDRECLEEAHTLPSEEWEEPLWRDRWGGLKQRESGPCLRGCAV